MSDIRTDVLVKIALKNGLVAENAINEALRERAEGVKKGQTERKLGDILVEKGLIDFERARELLRENSARSSRVFRNEFPESPAVRGSFEEVEAADPAVVDEEDDPGSTQRRERAARFGEYRLIQRLGVDSGGVTYHAVFLRNHHAVILRILNIRLAVADPEAVTIFMRTIKRAHKLRHPNIQKILTAGRQDKRLYYSAEYAIGHSLRKELSENLTLPVADAVGMAIEVTKALEYAHNKKIFHTQIDPAKIVLGADGHVKLVGFGLGGDAALNLDWLADSLGDLPYYIAPEMATGAEGKKFVGAVTDLYSLGAVLFHCLTGTPPFRGDSLDEVLLDMYQCENLHERLRAAEGCPADLVELVLHLLNPEPQKRLPSAHELLARLKKIAGHLGESAMIARNARKAEPRKPTPQKTGKLKTGKLKTVPTGRGVPEKTRLGSLSARIRQRLGRRKAERQLGGNRKSWTALTYLLVLAICGGLAYLVIHGLQTTGSVQKEMIETRLKAEKQAHKEKLRRAKELGRVMEAAKKEGKAEALKELRSGVPASGAKEDK